MAGVTNYQKPASVQNAGDELANFLKVFSGDVLKAFTRAGKVMGNHMTKSIDNGKATTFPVMGRGKAHYLPAGSNLDDLREAIPHNEITINIDGLLTADVLITDIYEAMLHYEVRSEYAKQLGEALAIASDGAVVAEIAKLVKANKENITGLGKGVVIEKTITGGAGINYETGKAVIEGLLEMKAKWTAQYVPEEERFAYITPEVESALIASKDAINKDYGAVATIVDGNIDKLCGFKIIAVPHLKAGGADKTGMLGTAPEGHVFPTEYAKALAVCAHRTAVATVKLKDLQLEHARRAELQADMIIAKNAVGHGGLRPEASGIILAK